MKEKILIIGGAGFIGHNLSLFLKKKKYDVTIVDNFLINNLISLKKKKKFALKNFYLKLLKERILLLKKNKIKIIKKDSRNYHSISRVIDKIKPNYIYHLAAVAHANVSNKDPFSTFDHSFRTLENVLDASRNLKNLKRLIFLSSSMVYGNFKTDTVNETTECNPLGIYGALKFGAEKLVIGYNQIFKLPYTIVRPSALYGERCVSGRVLQLFIENALQGKSLKIYGDGKEFLDFTYIDDFVNGLYLIIKTKKSVNQIFNLTYGKSRSLIDAANIVQKLIPNTKKEFITRDKNMPYRGTLSIKKAKNKLNYKPKFKIEKGIEKLISYYKKNFLINK
jgi:nucleoside-diphosphate-sugar epimerase